MRIFKCPSCGEPLYFHNLSCSCGAEVAYEPDAEAFVTGAAPCPNRPTIDCNWTAAQDGGLCRACAMTRTVPDAFQGDNRSLWTQAELAKRWVLANLGRWGWFKEADQGPRPVFDLLSETTASGDVQVTMGHDSGLVTINVAEADPETRVSRREGLGEKYRTMVGHFRHELGHFFFERMSRDEAFLDRFRVLFGDERADYGEALKAHYARADGDEAPPAEHITNYATAHPHEDWAETFAHLLHLADITDSFVAAGLHSPTLAEGTYDSYQETDSEQLLTVAAELGIALNHVNRSMGHSDLYPFVISAPVREKLGFVHEWIREPR
ncbi:zinc-binding metallopeptidase family protein [Roseitranquillus sediminis]|uniref:zinc-binding metallopeptidase family protein n=1 Tax=Roseitranquillus sediminis TaxID=2809051 RepID=UPI001D0C683F|nr:putative zinc-binding metallopeptidase [Roseitranquillus sediminis]MBM9593968.1 putative zinc-binding metallopeptidase [Roseitranquillus sediminis]